MRRLRGEQRDWTWEAELSAATFDAVQRLTYITLAVNGVKDAKEPKPYPRPGTESAAPKPVSLTAFASFIQEE